MKKGDDGIRLMSQAFAVFTALVKFLEKEPEPRQKDCQQDDATGNVKPE